MSIWACSSCTFENAALHLSCDMCQTPRPNPSDTIPSTETSDELCILCQVKPQRLRKCTGCQSVSYCSKECQKLHCKFGTNPLVVQPLHYQKSHIIFLNPQNFFKSLPTKHIPPQGKYIKKHVKLPKRNQRKPKLKRNRPLHRNLLPQHLNPRFKLNLKEKLKRRRKSQMPLKRPISLY